MSPLARTLPLVLFLAPAVARAQIVQPIAAGELVRVEAPAAVPKPVVGRVVSLTVDTLRMTYGTAQLALPRQAVTAVQASYGRNRLGWGIGGALVGGLAGAVLGAAAGGHDDPGGFGALAGFIAGGVVGLPLGAVTGALVAPQRWSARFLPWARS